ncbi:MAG: 2-C-methyl-D-erythritol 4-phosphate cytidylyltransferase [Candidatus Omnitrophica bacterium]|nr:2-C-methyl-D-erythritol 4-phosphate cytidylyltransferase [Candidatus Omnitrophota bacterium]
MKPKFRTIAIVPAAGSGRRLSLKRKKPFVLLRGMPIVIRTLKALEACGIIEAIVVASEPSCMKRLFTLVRRYRLKKVLDIVAGGRTRFESVRNCLGCVDPSFDIVVIHDGARPFVEKNIIEESIKLAAKFGGCISAVAENDTVKLAGRDLFVERTLDRGRLYRAQTPQVFRRDIIKEAYERASGTGITDDAGLVEGLGKKVKILAGSYRNIKITTKEDLKSAEAFL